VRLCFQEPPVPIKAQEKYDEVEMAYIKPYPKDFTKVSQQSAPGPRCPIDKQRSVR
jgi:hypothetical protein